MDEHTPGFYAIELQRMMYQHDISRAALMHNPHNDKIISEYNATMVDYLAATVHHNLRTDDKMTDLEKQARQYIKMPRMKQKLWDIKQRLR